MQENAMPVAGPAGELDAGEVGPGGLPSRPALGRRERARKLKELAQQEQEAEADLARKETKLVRAFGRWEDARRHLRYVRGKIKKL